MAALGGEGPQDVDVLPWEPLVNEQQLQSQRLSIEGLWCRDCRRPSLTASRRVLGRPAVSKALAEAVIASPELNRVQHARILEID